MQNIEKKTERGEIEIVSEFEPKMINRKGGSAPLRLNSENNEVIFVVIDTKRFILDALCLFSMNFNEDFTG